jgi:hypothetical protein
MDPRRMQQRSEDNLQTTQELRQLRKDVTDLKAKLKAAQGGTDEVTRGLREEMLALNRQKVEAEIEPKDARARLLAAQNAIRDVLAASNAPGDGTFEKSLHNARLVLERGQVVPGILKAAE